MLVSPFDGCCCSEICAFDVCAVVVCAKGNPLAENAWLNAGTLNIFWDKKSLIMIVAEYCRFLLQRYEEIM